MVWIGRRHWRDSREAPNIRLGGMGERRKRQQLLSHISSKAVLKFVSIAVIFNIPFTYLLIMY